MRLRENQMEGQIPVKYFIYIYQREQLNIASVRCSRGNRKKLCILMREPWRQSGGERQKERRMDGFPLIELFHNKVTRLATFPQPTLQELQGLPSYQPLQNSCEI
jgi:hypothetical protein